MKSKSSTKPTPAEIELHNWATYAGFGYVPANVIKAVEDERKQLKKAK